MDETKGREARLGLRGFAYVSAEEPDRSNASTARFGVDDPSRPLRTSPTIWSRSNAALDPRIGATLDFGRT